MPRSQPKYQQLADLLEDRIRLGEWKEGEQLPSEPQLAAELGVAYMTVRKAVTALIERGKLTRLRGRGTFIASQQVSDGRPILGLFVVHEWHEVDAFYFPAILVGFARRAQQLGYQILVSDRSEPLFQTFGTSIQRVKGVACIVFEQPDVEDALKAVGAGLPVVLINQYNGSRRLTSISPDNRDGAYQATKKLVELGHRRFSFLAGPKWNLDAVERRKGVLAALKDAGLQANLSVLEGGFTEDSGYARGRELLDRGRLPSAVITVGDLVSIGFMKAIQEEGFSIPGDVSVFGFGNFRLAAYMNPALTTVNLPLVTIGQTAAQALVDMCEGAKVESVKLPCPIVWRETVGPPPRK